LVGNFSVYIFALSSETETGSAGEQPVGDSLTLYKLYVV